MRYLVVFQRLAEDTFSAFVPDVPTCAATGTEVEVRARIRDALYISTRTMIAPPSPSAFTEEIDPDEASYEVRALLD
jgi:predicted RNase H-like HicB family nuclease